MRVLAAGDRMLTDPICPDLARNCFEYWRQKVQSGELTEEKAEALSLFVAGQPKLWNQKKIFYFQNPNNLNQHFALGFTGRNDILDRFRKADKSGIGNMQDIANLMHTAHIG